MVDLVTGQFSLDRFVESVRFSRRSKESHFRSNTCQTVVHLVFTLLADGADLTIIGPEIIATHQTSRALAGLLVQFKPVGSTPLPRR